MGDSQTTATSSTGSSDPQVKATLDKVLGQVNTSVDAGAPAAFNSSLYSPAGATTQAGWTSALAGANNPTYNAATQGTIASLGNAAAGGAYGQNDAAYQTLRDKAGNDALTSVNGVFNNSGRLGGGSNVLSAGQGVTNALAGLDVQQLQNDRAYQLASASALPGAYSASQLPASTIAGVGAAQDANQQGILTGAADLQQRQANNTTDWLSKISGILNGNAAAAGTTTTQTTPSTPWWQSALGLGLQAL